MIKFANTKIEGFEPAIRGMRNPMNSWANSDSAFFEIDGYYDILGNAVDDLEDHIESVVIGKYDRSLMETLRNAGPDHAKYRRMITVWTDILAPLYW